MSVFEVVEDLTVLRTLAEHELDEERRRALEAVRRRLARRHAGAKVSETAEVLGVSPPTVRSWIDAGVLRSVPQSSPLRVHLSSLATVKRAVDLLRANGQDRDLLAAIYRRLRDQDLLESDGFAAGIEDMRARRVVPIGDDLRLEMAELERKPLHIDEAAIAILCQEFHVRRLSIFGSAATAAFDPETSDVDFLVEFDDHAPDLLDAYFRLKEGLEALLGRPVDLVTPKSLENPYFAESVETTRRDLYPS